jgi:hypothetical protein
MKDRCLLFFVFIFLTLGFHRLQGYAVPSISFEREVEGQVVAIETLKAEVIDIEPPDIVLHKLVLKLFEGRGKYKSKFLTVYSRKRLPLCLFGQKIKVVVLFVGDERGGLYWLRELKVTDVCKEPIYSPRLNN